MAGHERYNPTLSKTQEKKRKRKRFPNVFFKKEINAVFSAMEDPKTMVGAFLTFFCALRQNEVCTMKWQDIDLENKQVKVVDGKCHKDGFIPLSPVAVPVLKKWRQLHPNEEYFLPPDSNDHPYMQNKALRNKFQKALKDAGLLIPTEKNASGNQQHQYKFHTLRHSRCTHLINNGVPIEQVQHFMRHDKIETTMVYIWITNPELKKMVAEVDTQQTKTQQQFSATSVVTEYKAPDPLLTIKMRLANGEISRKEYQKVAPLLIA